MKKVLWLCLLTVFLVGCGSEHRPIKPLTKGIEFSAEIKYYNELYECECDINANGELNARFTYPAEIEGLEFTVSKNGSLAEYEELQFINQNMLFENTAASLIWDVLVNVSGEAKCENEEFYLEGQTEVFKYRLYLGSSGLPIKLVTTPDIIEVVFKNVKIK